MLETPNYLLLMEKARDEILKGDFTSWADKFINQYNKGNK